MKTVFALDLATKTGWCLAPLGGAPSPTALERAAGRGPRQPLSGVKSFVSASGSHGALFAALDRWLSDMIAVHAPTVIVFEAPLPVHKGIDAARIAFGMAAQVERIAADKAIRCYEVNVQDVKKRATGKGNAPKGEMMLAARNMGWKFADDNEADALWLADYAVACLGE